MNYIYTFLLVAFSCTLGFAQSTIQGIVTDDETSEPIIGASLFIKGTTIGTVSDFNGFYKLDVKPGKYTLVCSFVGYPTKEIKKIVVKEGQQKKINFKLKESSVALETVTVSGSRSASRRSTKRKKAKASNRSTTLDEVVVTEYKVPTIAEDATTTGSVSPTSISSPPPPPPPPSVEEIFMVKESPAKAYDDGAMEVAEEDIADGEIATGGTGASGKKKRKKAGQLTAGEWKDLDNWTFWNDLKKDQEFINKQKYWNFYPNDRFTLMVSDDNDQAIADCRVSLVNKAGTVWKARTDNTGKAELWANLYEGNETDLRIMIEHQGQTFSLTSTKRHEQGINYFKMPANCDKPKNVDLFFVVDATGSMGDEINYLKAELSDVMNRVKEDNEDLTFRLGSLFYRDQGDQYVTRTSNFSTDISQTTKFIDNQAARGGGDYPEAVHTALDEAINKQKWSDDAMARILFFVLDAPPHHTEANIKNMQASIKRAAEMGIKVIPITASGIKKDTEFLMKFFAVATNGTYVFITDHSGIGNAHLKPTAESYNVETLNELMVRLILENTEFHECKEDQNQSLTQQDPNQDQNQQQTDPRDNSQQQNNLPTNPELMNKLSYYPNPAQDHVYIDAEAAFDNLTICSATGQEIRNLSALPKGQTKVDVHDLTPGVYFLKFTKDGLVTSGKLIIASDK